MDLSFRQQLELVAAVLALMAVWAVLAGGEKPK